LPTAALLGVLFLLPGWRARLRWPLLAAAVGSVIAVFVSRRSGEALEQALNLGGPVAAAVERHEQLADQLMWITVGFAAVVALAVLVAQPTRAPAAEDAPRGRSRRVVAETSLALVVVVMSVAVAVQTFRVGEAGTRAVWNPTGDATFSGD